MVGSIIIILGLLIYFKEHWVLENTGKGRRLIGWFGAANAPWVLRGLTVLTIIFGVLLAIGIIRPIKW
jgi:hypothetical protein